MADPTLADVAKQVADTQTALNIVWTLIAAFLVMFMQAGFAMVETGLAKAKNLGHTMGMNFLVYAIGVICYWAVGFGLQMGGMGPMATLGGDASLDKEFTLTIAGHTMGFFGMKGFFLPPSMFTASVATMFLFQMCFMDTTATIPTGAMAERWKFHAFVLFSCFITAFIYPVYGNWVWGGGWLATLGSNFGLGHGHVDFAGSSVVHLTGGVIAIVGAKLLGPRIGKYGPDGKARATPGHNVMMVVIGTFILAFGWFGFNAGSSLAGMDTRIAVAATNTMLASAAGAISAYLYSTYRFGKPDVTWMCNGMLAGMVAITAPCAFVAAWSSVLIGLISGVLVVVAALFVENTLKIDDPVGAVAVHGVNGSFGIIALGLFADGTYGEGWNGVPGTVKGLFYGDGSQLVAELIGIAANIAWVAPTAFIAYKIVDMLIGHRVSAEVEIEGLDIPEMGSTGYGSEAGHPVIPGTATAAAAAPALKAQEA